MGKKTIIGIGNNPKEALINAESKLPYSITDSLKYLEIETGEPQFIGAGKYGNYSVKINYALREDLSPPMEDIKRFVRAEIDSSRKVTISVLAGEIGEKCTLPEVKGIVKKIVGEEIQNFFKDWMAQKD